jgi:hypothetical protein
VELRSRENNDPAGRRQIAHGQRVELLLRLWLLAGITLDMLCCSGAIFGVPLIVVVYFGIVLYRFFDITRIARRRS